MSTAIRITLSCLITLFVLAQEAWADRVATNGTDERSIPADITDPEARRVYLEGQKIQYDLKEANRGSDKTRAAITSMTSDLARTPSATAAATDRLNTTLVSATREQREKLRSGIDALTRHQTAITSAVRTLEERRNDPGVSETEIAELERSVDALRRQEAAINTELGTLGDSVEYLDAQRELTSQRLSELGSSGASPGDSPDGITPSTAADPSSPSIARVPPSPTAETPARTTPEADETKRPPSSRSPTGGSGSPQAEKKSADATKPSGSGSPSMPSLPSAQPPTPTNLGIGNQLSPPSGACPPDQPTCMLCAANPRAPGCPGAQEPTQGPQAVKQDQETKKGGADSLAGPTRSGKTPLDLSELMKNDGQRSGAPGQLPPGGAAGVGTRGLGSQNDSGARAQPNQGAYGSPATISGSSGSFSGSGSGTPAKPGGGYPSPANPFNRIAEKTIGKAAYQRSLGTARYARSMHEQMFYRYRRGPAASTTEASLSSRLKADGVTGPHTNQFNKMRSRYVHLFER